MSATQGPGRSGSVLAEELGLAGCLWWREVLRFARERTRWFGAIVQPLLFWVFIGQGMADTFRLPGAEDVGALMYFFPGIIAMVVLFTTIFTTISVVDDRQQGFLQAVLVSPASRWALVLGKVAGVVTLTLLQCTLFAALAPLAGYSFGDVAWAELALAIVVAAAGLTAMNFTVAWVLDSVQGYHAIMMVVLLPLWFLSGALFPRPDGWLGALMVVNPLTYMVDCFRSALAPEAAGTLGFGYGLSLTVLLVYGLVMTALAVVVSQRRGRPA